MHADIKKQFSGTIKDLDTVAKGAGVILAGKFAGSALKYLTQIILARMLGFNLFGIYALGMVIYQAGELFSRMGLQSGSVRYVSIYDAKRDVQRLKGALLGSLKLSFLGGLICGFILFLSSHWIAVRIFNKPDLSIILRIFALGLPFGASMTVLAFATTGFRSAKYFVYIRELFQPFANLLFVAVFFILGFGIYGTAWAWVISSVLALICIAYFVRNIFPQMTQGDIRSIRAEKELLKFSLPLAMGELVLFFLIWTDILMLGYFRPVSEVGIYRAVAQTALLLSIIHISLNTIFPPIIANSFGKDDRENLGVIFKTTTRWGVLLTVPLFLVTAIAGDDILSLFGPGLVTAWRALVILSIGQLVNVATGGVGSILAMSGHQYIKFFMDLLLAIANILLNILLIPRFGIIGAAVATAISMTGVNLIRVLGVYATTGVHAYSRSYLKIIIAAAIAACAGIAIKNVLASSHFIISLFVTSAVISLAYAFSIVAIGLEHVDKIIYGRLKGEISSFFCDVRNVCRRR